MKARPILFSAPMVRALLDGRKTQTRRVVKPQPGELDRPFLMDGTWHVTDSQGGHMSPLGPHNDGACPYGVPGDLLWVKESWRYINHQNGPKGFEVCVGYEADGENLPNRPSLLTGPGWEDKVDRWPFRSRRWPSIHMPRWASRLTLEITDVRVERLQAISRADAIAEGLQRLPASGRWVVEKGQQYAGLADHDPRLVYSWLWEAINGPGSWAANPWVWVVEFKVHAANVDAVLSARNAA
jgi:hypothetical protein